MSGLLRLLDRGYTMIWREGRLEDALRGLDEDFEWVFPDHPEGAVRRGPDSVIEFFRDLIDRFPDLDVEWELHEAGPGSALAVTRMQGHGRESGVPTETRFAQLWTLRDGRLTSMVLYNDVDEARRAAGLDPPPPP
jgi:ketosteroid isomerase-like protein